MHVSYSWSKVERSNLNLQRKEIIDRISNLKEQLVRFGYNRQEVDYIAREYAGGAVSELQLPDLKKLEAALKRHLDMAGKCLAVR